MERERGKIIYKYFILETKIVAILPKQGYSNAPTYYTPEYLRQEIEAYAKKHYIKD